MRRTPSAAFIASFSACSRRARVSPSRRPARPVGDSGMNLQQLRRLHADAEAAIRRVSIVKLASTILVVFAVTFAVFVLLALLTS